jgi:ATP-dependent phosphoenolpyruvate carboxykinase
MDLAVRKMTLGRFGVENVGAVHENLPPARLVEASVRRREGMISGSGALVVRTGKRTGRSPKDRFIVEDDLTRERVDWGAVNKPFSAQAFEQVDEVVAEKNREALRCYETYMEVIERSRRLEHVGTTHYFEIFQELHDPWLEDITAHLEE